jgi:ferredoxin-NADP reductase
VWEFDTRFSEVIQRTTSIKSFRFASPVTETPYKPGQFFFVTIDVGGAPAAHHFSFSSSPSESGHLEFTKRITESDYSKALAAIKPGGEPAHIKGPAGSFLLPETETKLAFLCGGIGITPVRSMLRWIVDMKLPYDAVLLYGSGSLDETAFREELDEMISFPGIRVEYVLSEPVTPAKANVRVGLIDEALVAALIPDYDNRLFYISGPPRMVTSLEAQVKELGVKEQRIKRDSFTGYD